MTSVEIANAYVALTTKMPGVKKEIASALSGASSEVERSGSGLGGNLMKGIGGAAVAGAAVAGAAIAVTLGTALTKGFQRLNAIDQATAKMEGLGFTSDETAALMDNALESVRGTAFGLGDAATVASQLAASGLGPGQDMADILSTVANTAAAAGAELSDIGSIFAKVQSTGKAQNDVLQQLADRGIPIYQKLADQLGVSTDEVFDLASAGKIGFAEFEAAAEAASGGVAAAMGGTVQGSFDNLTASLGRIGAGLLGGTFDQLAPLIQSVTTSLGPLEAIAATVGENIGDFLAPALEGFISLLDSGIDFSMFGELLSYLSPLGVAFKVLEPVLPVLMESFGQIATVLGGALSQVLSILLPILGELVVLLSGAIAQILPAILPLFTSLAEIIGQVLLAVTPLLEPLMQLITAIFPILQAVIAAVVPVIQGVVDAIGSFLLPIVDTLVAVLGGVIEFLTGVFTGDWEKAWDGIVAIFEGIFNGIVDIGVGIINGLIDLINGFLGGLNEVGNFVSDATGGAINFEVGTIPHLAEGGIVSRRQGGTLAVVGEGRYDEAVVPLSPQVLSQIGGGGRGDQTWNVYGSDGMDPLTLAEIVRRKVNDELEAG